PRSAARAFGVTPLIIGLDGLFIGESLQTSHLMLGTPQPAIFRQVPAWQWKRPSGLVITAIVGHDGTITLINETAAPDDNATGLAEEDSRESAMMFNADTHASLALQAPSTACKGGAAAGTQCWEYQYDRDTVLRAQFTPDGQGDTVLRDVTVASPSLLAQLHIDE
ncbi:MAG TPA: hypothetical protein VF778_07725, partial [Xanthobacteraceae bacterium]